MCDFSVAQMVRTRDMVVSLCFALFPYSEWMILGIVGGPTFISEADHPADGFGYTSCNACPEGTWTSGEGQVLEGWRQAAKI